MRLIFINLDGIRYLSEYWWEYIGDLWAILQSVCTLTLNKYKRFSDMIQNISACIILTRENILKTKLNVQSATKMKPEMYTHEEVFLED